MNGFRDAINMQLLYMLDVATTYGDVYKQTTRNATICNELALYVC